ncbi:hypothetical protein KKA95_04475 [Patescibacteria group bacterium]|nr:hypothetical protein [Patescibacteria group bacterium]
MFKNKFKGCDASKVWRVIFIIWIVFASLYVVYSEYSRLQTFVAKSAYNSGITTAVAQIMQEASKCQVFPVTLEGKQVNLVNYDCLNTGEKEAE